MPNGKSATARVPTRAEDIVAHCLLLPSDVAGLSWDPRLPLGPAVVHVFLCDLVARAACKVAVVDPRFVVSATDPMAADPYAPAIASAFGDPYAPDVVFVPFPAAGHWCLGVYRRYESAVIVHRHPDGGLPAVYRHRVGLAVCDVCPELPVGRISVREEVCDWDVADEATGLSDGRRQFGARPVGGRCSGT